MKRAQLIGITIALVAGGAAFLGMQLMVAPKPPQVVQEKTIDSVRVLVASDTIGLGERASPANFKWMEWPASAAQGSSFITNAARPNAISELTGAVARTPIERFEPITENKLIRAGKGGVLAAILPSGMRAVSTKVTQLTAAAKLILPNDHVDVILTERKRGRSGNEDHVSRTLFRNIRVLAMGQQIEANKDQKDSAGAGDVATLELTPSQAEQLARANMMGEISLALRSVADMNSDKGNVSPERKKAEGTDGVRMLKYGVKGRAYGIN
jgi:pilus assembly protein CpaB